MRMISLGLAAGAFALVGQSGHGMEFRSFCFGNYWESCGLYAEGPITAETPAAFRAAVDGLEGKMVRLNSPGGDPLAAIEVGRMIRERKLETVVGGMTVKDFAEEADGSCLGACLLALAGGEVRYVDGDSRVAVGPIEPVPGVSEATLSLRMAAHLMEMGVDAEVLLPGFERQQGDFLTLPKAELEAFGVVYVPPGGFGRFVMEPYKEGVVAVSTRLDKPHIYNRVSHLTAFCRDGDVHFLMTAIGDFMAEGGGSKIVFANGPEGDARSEVDVSNVKTWTSETDGFVQFSIDPSLLPELDDLARLEVRYSLSRVQGWEHYAGLDMSAMDRQMLKAAFRFCI